MLKKNMLEIPPAVLISSQYMALVGMTSSVFWWGKFTSGSNQSNRLLVLEKIHFVIILHKYRFIYHNYVSDICINDDL